MTAGMVNAATLDDVKARGNLNCGVSTGAPGFATIDDSGKNVGFDVDYCRALAAAIFGDPMAVKFVPLTSAMGPIFVRLERIPFSPRTRLIL